jgi:hypothetical protein
VISTKDKDIRDTLATKEVVIVSKITLLCHKSEVDTDESNHDYQTKTMRAVLTGNTVNENFDFNIPLTDRSIGVTEFQSSDFTIWINFRLFFMCMGEGNGIPCEEDGIHVWIHHFGSTLQKPTWIGTKTQHPST